MIEPLFELANAGLQAILKNYAELCTRLFCGLDQSVCAFRAYIHGLFCQHVQAAPGCGDAVSGVQAGRASDDHEIDGAVGEKSVEVLIWLSAVFAAEARDAF